VSIDRLAREGGNAQAIAFPRAQLGPDSLDFSFSGLKTSVLTASRDPNLAAVGKSDWAASVQEAIVDVLVSKTLRAAQRHNVRHVLVAGGVAANSRLQTALRDACAQAGLRLTVPPPRLCTDNAAMIACAGFYHLEAGRIDGLNVDTLASERLA
jgi:N6-L-threonylcarbamoyladenine synthase